MQRGRIHRNGSSWFLTYRKPEVTADGKRVWRQTVVKLAPVSAAYRTASSVRPLAEEILGPINAGTVRPESTQRLADFMEHYLLHCRSKLRPATADHYRHLWKMLEPHVADMRLRDFHTPQANDLLAKVAALKIRSHFTHRGLKSFLSGAFKYARRTGAVNANPMVDVEIPRGKPKRARAAYTLDEISAMLRVLPEPSRTAVLVAALTGLRISELKGLKWEDFTDEGTVMIRRSVWHGIVNDTKTLFSTAPVPVVPQVLAALKAHRQRDFECEWVFHGLSGKPLRLEDVVRYEMIEPLKAAGINWRGWHPFRYGVASTLYALGVDQKLIQQILRHSDPRTTLEFYVKPTGAATREALLKLDAALDLSRAKENA